MNKYKLFILFFTLSCILVTMDLITTRIALINPNNYEYNIFGNNPYIEYPTVLGIFTMFYLFEYKMNMRHYISFAYSTLPLIAIISNIIIILRG